MTRASKMPDALVDEIRDLYRRERSFAAVVHFMRRDGRSNRYFSYQVMLLDTFRLRVWQLSSMMSWFPGERPSARFLTDEEVDARMVPEIESRRHLWDRPACDDDRP